MTQDTKTFYDGWLGRWDIAEQERRVSRKVIHAEELEWVETPQDPRSALVISRETGFRTWGSVTMLSELPPNWTSGQHKHGEEAMYILSGEGYSVIDNVRYNWRKGSVLAIPFGSVHRHYNTGAETVRYLSVMSPDLEHFVGLHKLVQLEEHGEITSHPDVPTSEDGLLDGRRITLNRDDVQPLMGVGAESVTTRYGDDDPLVVGNLDGMSRLRTHHRSSTKFMRVGKDQNDFRVHEQEISSISSDGPGEYGGKHAHMEAHLYVLQGSGYTVIDGEKHAWRPGTGIFISGPQTVHQHFNESDEPTEMLRIATGIRYFFEDAASREFPYVAYSPRKALAEAFAEEGAPS